MAELLAASGISAGVINMRFAKPLDEALLREEAIGTHFIVTLEEGALAGGVGAAVTASLNRQELLGTTKILNFGIPDEFVPQGEIKQLLQDLGLTAEEMAAKVADHLTK